MSALVVLHLVPTRRKFPAHIHAGHYYRHHNGDSDKDHFFHMGWLG